MASDHSTHLEPQPTMAADNSEPLSEQTSTNGDDTNSKRDREETDEIKQQIDDKTSKKQKFDDYNDEKSVEVNEDDLIKENSGPVNLGPKLFESSLAMFEYFFKFLRDWPVNIRVNKYEYLVLLDLIKKGHPEPDRKIGSGVDSFEVRNHPEWKSRCFFAVRADKTVEDFSFRKCVDHILPLPDNIKNKFDSIPSGGGGGRRGGSGKGGGRGRGRGRGGKFRR